jgi:hypothetical protein
LIIDSIEELKRYAAEAQRRGMNEDNVVFVRWNDMKVRSPQTRLLDPPVDRHRAVGILAANFASDVDDLPGLLVPFSSEVYRIYCCGLSVRMLLFENVLVHVDWKSGVWVSSQNRTIQSY